MKAILIPVKSFLHSKTRLAPHFSQSARAALAAALCEDFFGVVARVRREDTRVFVVSREPIALERARSHGWDTIVETEQISENHSVDSASLICAEAGMDALLRIPMDLPLATAKDIEAILAQTQRPPSAVLVPSRDGTGTNALLRSPPALFASNFGPNSFARHLADSERCGANVKIMHNPRIALDIDELDDLRALAGRISAHSKMALWLKANLPS